MTMSFSSVSKFWKFAAGAAFSVALTLAPTVNAVADDIKAPEGFEVLFDGTSYKGWHGRPHYDPRTWDKVTAEQRAEWDKDMQLHWSFENNELVNDGNGVYMTTDRDFGDMELLIEYKTVAKADSGIYLRSNPQVQIWDSTEEAKFNIGANLGSGGLWNNSPGAPGKDPKVKADKPFGEWNKFRILQVGSRTSVWLNGEMVVDHAIMENFWDRTSPLFAKGPVQLQTHGGEIRWRNIFVREIGAEEANQILASKQAEGFQSLFDGKSLEGWKGAVDNYEVVNGAIRCKEGKGGVLHTAKEYGNFQVALQFRLPPGGNNGLAIRYPGEGDTAYVGMCELQVLDNDAPQYAKLDPRQYHGSAYGMIAAKRGYHRPTGEWNYQVVTVEGSKIKVELNGTVILDGDLSTVKDLMANTPHPGKDRTSGFFGFAGHGDAVEFRNVEIRELK
jgi:hypothetical protein